MRRDGRGEFLGHKAMLNDALQGFSIPTTLGMAPCRMRSVPRRRKASRWPVKFTDNRLNGIPKNDQLLIDDLKTAPMDYRFPATNQAKHCYYSYNEFHKCAAEKGEDSKDCQKYARFYRSLCPGEWVEKWNEERANGTFPGRY